MFYVVVIMSVCRDTHALCFSVWSVYHDAHVLCCSNNVCVPIYSCSLF